MFQLVAAGALSSALIPVIAGLFAKEEDARAWRVVSTVATLMLAALMVLVALVLWFAPELMAVITPGFNAAQLAQTTELTRIMAFAPVLLAAGAIATSVLNSRERFGAAALAPLVYNLAMIFGAIALVPVFGVQGLAYGVVLGALGHILVQVPALIAIRARIRPFVDLHDDQARTALLLMVPRAIGLGATQIVFVVMTSLASTLGAGAISVFNFSFAMLQIPIGVIGVPLGIILLPSLSREAALGAGEGFTRLVTRGLALLGYVMVAIAALGIVVSGDLVHLLFGGTRMEEPDLQATAAALSIFLFGLTAHSLIAVLARSFYALKDTATPVGAALLAVVANIVIANLLVGRLGLNGLAAAIAISAWLETMVLVVLLVRRVPGLRPGLGHVWLVMAKTGIVSLAGALVAYGVSQALIGAWGLAPGILLLLLRISLAVAAGGIVIIAGSLALHIEELRSIVGVMVDLLRRRGRA